MLKLYFLVFSLFLAGVFSCSATKNKKQKIKPAVVTQKVANDTDDPAIWINPEDKSKSLIIGTDKGGKTGEGGLYIFDLSGRILVDKTVPLQRPNNVDVAYGLFCNHTKTDVVVCTERNRNMVRVFSLPDMKSIDRGGIPVFEDSDLKAPMGIALYTDEQGNLYTICGRKSGPSIGYLYQYRLEDDGTGHIHGKLVRKFGRYSGVKEIESIVVDQELGYVYYSDEGVGVRKYYAHPDSNDVELALFATEGIRQDHEGLSIYKCHDGRGYILLSDQQSNTFHIFPREGTTNDPHAHPLLKKVLLSTKESDGSEVTNTSLLPAFPNGMLVAMSTDGTFHYYRWENIAGKDLFLAPDGQCKPE